MRDYILIVSFFVACSLLSVVLQYFVGEWRISGKRPNWDRIRSRMRAYPILFLVYVIPFILVVVLTFNIFHRTSLDIADPASGSVVQEVVDVQGTARNIAASQDIWVFLKPHETNLYYPQSGPALLQKDGGWSNTNVRLGGGSDFDIVAVLATKEASHIIQEHLRKNEPLPSLPIGAAAYDRVTVRKAQ